MAGHMLEVPRGSLEPLTGWLEDHAGRPLPPARHVTFSMRPSGAQELVVDRAAATVIEPLTAQAAWYPRPGETDTPGFYEGVFGVDGRRVPDRGWIPISITS